MAELFDDGAVSVESAADFLAVSKATIYKLMERGELPFIKIHGKGGSRGCRRIPKRALVDLMARNLQGGWKIRQ